MKTVPSMGKGLSTIGHPLSCHSINPMTAPPMAPGFLPVHLHSANQGWVTHPSRGAPYTTAGPASFLPQEDRVLGRGGVCHCAHPAVPAGGGAAVPAGAPFPQGLAFSWLSNGAPVASQPLGRVRPSCRLRASFTQPFADAPI